MSDIAREARFAEFLKRLQNAPPVTTPHGAKHQMDAILDAVEDELTSLPNEPSQWRTDGRMYPPQNDRMRRERRSCVWRARFHLVRIAENGALQILDLRTEHMLIDPRGADGRTATEVLREDHPHRREP